ncbi:MAG TPA: hypothetical protein VNO87_04185 [Methylomirabilota bacterium]|nr:hypothetical protein [Methylomirabilota bacterium]
MKNSASLVAFAFLVAGCGGQGSHSSASPKATSSVATSPTSSSAASPAPLTGAFAVLATPPSADSYTLSIVGVDGKVVASAQASSPTALTCGDAAAAVLPLPISTSDDRAYYMDAQGVVRFLTVQGESGRATTVPVGGGRRSMFAVSPDDQRIAVIVSDFTSAGAAIKLYVEDLNGGSNHADIYSQSNAFSLWPIGWHGIDNLVVAKVPACTQGGGPFSASPLELHVVDPATAERHFTLGGQTCVVAGAASPAGVLCEDTSTSLLKQLTWTGGIVKTFPLHNLAPAYLSPDGSSIAVVGVGVTNIFVGGSQNFAACGWIDSTHMIGGTSAQPRVWDFTKAALIPVAAQGICAGRLPGGL